MSTNDTALLQRWTRHRDADAFTELVDRHGGMVYGACRRVLGDIHEAQDAAQESFMELMRAPHAITASLPGWLHTVAVRRSLDRIKQSQRRRQREEAFAARAGAAAEAAPDDLLAVVDEAIAAQPDLYRVPIVLRFLEGRTHAEIGAQLGVAESTVRHRIEKGVEQVRETLRKRGVLVGAGSLAVALEGQAAQAAPAGLAAALGRLAVSGAVPAAAGVLGAGRRPHARRQAQTRTPCSRVPVRKAQARAGRVMGRRTRQRAGMARRRLPRWLPGEKTRLPT